MGKKGICTLLLFMSVLSFTSFGCSTPQVGGTLVQPLIGNPGPINPLLSVDSAARVLESQIFQGLIGYSSSLEPEGLLATDWEISHDGLVWTFYLREEVFWHDGEPFTAQDVKFTFDTVAFNQDYPGTLRDRLDMLEKVEVVDELTVEFTLNTVFAPFINSLTLPIVPRHLYDPRSFRDADYRSISDLYSHPANWNPIGTGPWRFGGWGKDTVILNRNPQYWDSPRPYIETLEYRYFPDSELALSALQARELDLWAGIPVEQLDKLQRTLSSTHEFYEYADMNYEFMGFNFRDNAFGEGLENPWQDLRVRQAIAHALNRPWYVNQLLRGRGTVIHAGIPQQSWAFDRDSQVNYRYDHLMAEMLLDDAGWEMGEDGYRYKLIDIDDEGNPVLQRFEFSLTTNALNSLRTSLGEMIKRDLERIGIKVNLNYVGWTDLLNKHVYPGDFHAILLGWSMGVDPDMYSIFHSTQARDGLNFGLYHNSTVDLLLETGRRTMDLKQRSQIYSALQLEMSQDLPYVFLFSRKNVAAVNSNIRGIVLSPLGLWNNEQWYIDD